MKTKDVPSSEFRGLFLVLLLLVIFFCCSVYYNQYIYNSIDVVVKEGNNVIEYGSANYDIHDFIERVEGKIVSVKNEVDTNIIGEQEVIVEVKKNNVYKEIPIVLSVVDTVSPVINIKEEKVTITQGDDYDLTWNVESVSDEVDGDISYSGEVTDDSNLYYNFSYDTEEIDSVGEHKVQVNAKDVNGNVSTVSFTLEVVEPPKPVYIAPVTSSAPPVYYNDVPANASGGDLVSLAYSYVGYPYVSGANGPNAFDCSGFVQYLYSRVGIGISRSTSTQIHDGVPVSYDSAQPGDILLWGYTEGSPTHSALYVGNGQMVHATNPSQGVLASDVAAWTRGSGTHVIAVRRIQ